jgi:asparagine synthase (glutamine-hydrolysing)
MCGIAGMASLRPVDDRELLVRMRDRVTHRGPDDAGVWWNPDGTVGLAQRRLSIIDLSAGGHQPKLDRDRKRALVFNGELYNFRELRRELEGRGHAFETSSDTEVVLAAYVEWGDDFLSRLIGMFALAICDDVRGEVLIARDRAGEKPLFYFHDGSTLLFASELKSLLEHPSVPRTLDPHAFESYLAYGYVPGGDCILAGCRKLPPAHAMRFELRSGVLRTWPYWTLPGLDAPVTDARLLEEELEGLLEDAVRRQLVADVPVGILLSGGVDSSLVTAMAARVQPGAVRTFTISFPGHGAFDEAPFARRVAEHFGTQHTELVAEPASVDLLPLLARQYDEPIADSSMVPTYLVSRLIREHATVALGGDGGDELFGGYGHYPALVSMGRVRDRIPSPLLPLIGAIASRAPVGLRGRGYALSLAGGAGGSIARVNSYFDSAARERLMTSPVTRNGHGPEAAKAALADPSRSMLQNAMRTDFLTYLPDDILVKVDRASMLTSLEVRAPWLDHRIIELAFRTVPDHLKVAGGEKKILPRRLAARLLPPDLDLRRKQGFSIPLHEWFRGPWGETMESILMDAGPQLFRRKAIEELIANQRRGMTNHHRIFALTIFELWRREYGISA